MLHGRTFALSLSVGTAIALAAAIASVWGYWDVSEREAQYLATSYANQFAQGAFTLWMPMCVSQSLPNLFFFIAPLLISLAYAWSWRSDLDSGYAQSVMVRSARTRVYWAKAVATFLSGALVVALPLLVNLAVVLCLVPAYVPDIIDVVYTGLWEKVFLSEVLYRWPALYVALRLLIDAVLAGLWATTVLALSIFVRNRVAIVALPYVALVVIKYVSERVYVLAGVRLSSLTILDQLKARGDAFYYDGAAVLAGALVMVAVALLVPIATRGRDVL